MDTKLQEVKEVKFYCKNCEEEMDNLKGQVKLLIEENEKLRDMLAESESKRAMMEIALKETSAIVGGE